MPSILDLVTIRPEVLSGELHGIIRLSDVLSPGKPDVFEKNPERVLSATYPSEAMRLLLHRLGLSLAEEDADRKGNYIIAGGYGSGKSHLLLTLYHILNSPQPATAWLEQHGIEFRPPDAAEVVLMPMHQMRLPGGDSVRYLWEPIFTALDYQGFVHDGNNFPTIEHLHEAVDGRRVFLIVDEIERWFGPIQEPARKSANETFLQNLTEFCEDPANGIVSFITLLRIEPRICDILDRADRWPEDMTRAPDKRQIVLHRLIESVEPAGAEAVAASYVEQYRSFESHLTIADFGAYREDMVRCYPFHPATIDVVLERYSSVASRDEGSYQNSRGALALMAELLKTVNRESASASGRLAKADLLLPGDVSIASPAVFARLSSLDAKLVEIAHRNLHESDEVRLADAIISTVLLHSLGEAGQERKPGAQLGDVLLGTVRPQDSAAGQVNPNAVLASLENLDETAQNMHREENPSRWVFRADVNIQAQINRRAKTKSVQERAPQRILDAIHSLVPGNAVVYPSEEVPSHRDITIVISTEYIEGSDVLARVYADKQFPNGLIVVSPRDRIDVMEHPSVLSLAQRTIAANDILSEMLAVESPPDILRQVARSQDLEKELAGLYGRLLVPIHDADTDDIGFRAYEVELRKDAIMRAVEERGTEHGFEQAVMSSVRSRGQNNQPPPTVGDIYQDFYQRRHYPKPVARGKADWAPVDGAIRRLVRIGQLEVIYGGGGKYDCGKDPGQPERSWTVAIPPEEHLPAFDVPRAVVGYLKARGQQGASVGQVRAHCHEKAADEFPDAALEDATVDDTVIDLIAQHQLETPEVREVPNRPLPEALVVRYRVDEAGTTGQEKHQTYTIPHLPAGAAKNRIMTDIRKTDKLSEVTFEITQRTNGKELVDCFGGVLGVQAQDIAEDTDLSVHWRLRETRVTNRDELVSLLDRLPREGDAQVAVSLKRESPRPQGDQQ